MPRPKADKKVLGRALAAAKNIHYGRGTAAKSRQTNAKTSQILANPAGDGKDEGKSQIPSSHTLQLIKDLKSELKPLANKQSGVAMKGYMRNQFEFLGIQAQPRRTAHKQFLLQCKKLDCAQIKELVEVLWKEPEREYQYTAHDLCVQCLPVLCGKTDADCHESLMWVKLILTTKSWWDTVDAIACKVVGVLVSHCPATQNTVMDAWIQDDNMWLRRTAILHQLAYKEKTDKDRLFRYCRLCAEEEEFFIRKAIGWALRNYYRVNREAVRKFVAQNKSKLSNLSIKEALKHD